MVGGFNNWSNPGTQKFTAGANGIYTLDYKGELSGQFKITDGSWTDANCYGGNGSPIVLGEPYKCSHPATAGDPGNMTFADGAVENPKFELNTNTGVLTVTGEKGNVNITYVIHGNIVTGSWEDLTLTDNNGNWTATDVTCKAGEFGIKENTNGSQSSWYAAPAGQQNVGAGSTVTCSNNNPTNFSIGAGTYSFSFNATTKVLSITGEGSTIEPDPTPGDLVLYVIGNDVNGKEWELADPDAKMTKTGEGVYTWTGTSLGDTFKINDGSWNGAYNIGQGQDGTLTLGVPYTIYNGQSADIVISSGAVTNPKIVLDLNASTVTVTGDGSDEPVIPTPGDKTLYLVGAEYGNWASTSDAYKFENDGDVYTLKINGLKGEWKIWDGTWDYTFGAGDDQPTVGGGEVDVWFGSPTNFDLNTDSTVVITLKAVAKNDVASKLSVTTPTGIESIEAENGPVQYFNLQGVRVANPENGIFIRVQNGKAVKIVK